MPPILCILVTIHSPAKSGGKVRNFGVSNQNPMQIELLSRYLNQKIIANQLQLSITNTGMIDAGLNVNMEIDSSLVRDGSILDYCRLKDITIQAWSPFQYGFFEGVFLNNDKFPELNRKIDEIAEAKGVTNSAIAVAWILRHPAKIQTMQALPMQNACKISAGPPMLNYQDRNGMKYTGQQAISCQNPKRKVKTGLQTFRLPYFR